MILYLNNQISMVQYLIFVPLCLIAFSPPLAFFISIIALFLIGRFDSINKARYFFLYSFISFISLLISMTSVELFLYEESDFTGYYNNYLKFLNNGFKLENFEYGGGVEFVLPLINYILSLIIRENTPYLILLCHSTILLILLFYIVHLIRKYYNLNLKETSILLAFSLLLYKYGSSLNHLRQAYATMFIIIAIFSKKYNYIFYIIAIFTHLSSVIIYPLVKFLLFSKSQKNLKLFIIIISLLSILINLLFTDFYYFIMGSDFILFTKIRFALIMIMENHDTTKYLITSIEAVFYIIVILFLFKILSIKKKTIVEWNLYAIIIFVVGLSFLPGIAFRLIAPILTVLLGYLFFKYLRIEIKFKQTYLVGIFLLIFFQFKWIFFNVGYYQKYPLGSVVPFYYISTYFESVDFINRQNLPSLKDIQLENKNKL